MFTGIIEEIGSVIENKLSGSGYHLKIKCKKILEDMKIGDSISIDGVCQTVEEFGKDFFKVFVSKITAEITTLSVLKINSEVNLERAMSAGSRFGGHMVQGHVEGKGRVTEVLDDISGKTYNISADSSLMRYIIPKGSISINGVSLTVVDTRSDGFSLYIIPETIKKTTISNLKSGSSVNIETDIIGKYIEKYFLESKTSKDTDLMKKLIEEGYA